MHTLSKTLLTAQRGRSAIPYVDVSLAARWGGTAQLRWERLYTGTEPDGAHAAIVSAIGAMIRVRAQAKSNGLFAQRAVVPGPVGQFGTWKSLGTTSPAGGVAVAEIGGRIRIFDVEPNGRDIRERSSLNGGMTFGSPTTIATNAAPVRSLAVASGAGGAALILYADSTGALRAMTREAGAWTAATLWANTLSSIDGVACASIDGDWAVVVCGTLEDGSSGVWSCVLGAGSSQTAGTWSSLREVIASASGAGVTYRQPSLCVADGPRLSFVESFGGVKGYVQTLTTHAPASARFRDHRWREPSPFVGTPRVGPALAANSSHAWLTTPSGVWRAGIAAPDIDLSDSVIYADVKEAPRGSSLTLHLAEDSRLDSSITTGSGPLGHEVSIAWGYETSAGGETGQAQRYWTREVRRETRRGGPVTVLEAEDAWWFLANTRTRRQLVWPAHTTSVWNILLRLLTMAGLSASLARSSPSIVSTYPAMTVSPNESIAVAINRLMARVPDLLRFSDGVMEAIQALATDSAVYAYGGAGEHALLDAGRSSTLSRVNHVQVYGDGAVGQAVNEAEVESIGNLLVQVVDRSLTTAHVAAIRAEAELRTRGALQPFARITVPVNAGQQLHDVVTVTAPDVGWDKERLRVAGLRTRYDVGGPQSVYRQDIDLGGV